MKRRSEGRKKQTSGAPSSQGAPVTPSGTTVTATPQTTSTSPSARAAKSRRRNGNTGYNCPDFAGDSSVGVTDNRHSTAEKPIELKQENESFLKQEIKSEPVSDSASGKKVGKSQVKGTLSTCQMRGSATSNQSAGSSLYPGVKGSKLSKNPHKDADIKSNSESKRSPVTLEKPLLGTPPPIPGVEPGGASVTPHSSFSSSVTSWNSISCSVGVKREVVASKLSTALLSGSYPPASAFGSSVASPSSLAVSTIKRESDSHSMGNTYANLTPTTSVTSALPSTLTTVSSNLSQRVMQGGSSSHFKPLPQTSPLPNQQNEFAASKVSANLAYPHAAYPQTTPIKLSGYQVEGGLPLNTVMANNSGSTPLSKANPMYQLGSHISSQPPAVTTTVSILSQQLSSGLQSKPISYKYHPSQQVLISTSGILKPMASTLSPPVAATADLVSRVVLSDPVRDPAALQQQHHHHELQSPGGTVANTSGFAADFERKNIAIPPKKRKAADMEAEAYNGSSSGAGLLVSVAHNVPTPSVAKKPVMTCDLREWKNQRVLAKRHHVFEVGVIKGIHSNHHDLDVEFEADRSLVTFSNVFDLNSCMLVGDNHPTPSKLCVNSAVCVRVNQEKNVFYEGVIIAVEKRNSPASFRIQLKRTPSPLEYLPEETHASRANIRLLQPPWFDDLEELGMSGGMSMSSDSVVDQCFSPVNPLSAVHHPGAGYRLERPVSSSAGSLERADSSDDEMMNDSYSFDSSGMSTPR